MAGQFGRVLGNPQASGRVFSWTMDGGILTGRARRFRVSFPFGSGCPVPVQRLPGQWSAVPSRTLLADRFPVHGQRLPVPGSLRALVSLSSIAPDWPTLNPVYFLLYVYFLDRVFLDREKVIFWTFSVLVEFAMRSEKARRNYSGGLLSRIVAACNRAERPTCGAVSFVLQAVGFLFGQYPRFTNLVSSFPALTAFPQCRYTQPAKGGGLFKRKEQGTIRYCEPDFFSAIYFFWVSFFHGY